jgi:hypothetical protein
VLSVRSQAKSIVSADEVPEDGSMQIFVLNATSVILQSENSKIHVSESL